MLDLRYIVASFCLVTCVASTTWPGEKSGIELWANLRGQSVEAVRKRLGEPGEIRKQDYRSPVRPHDLPKFAKQWVYIIDGGGYGHLLLYVDDNETVVFTVYEFADF